MDIIVRNSTEFGEAYKTLLQNDGGRILLQAPEDGASFGNIGLTGNRDSWPSPEVVIASLDPENPTTINRLGLTHVDNVRIEDIHVEFNGVDTRNSMESAVYVTSSSNIVFSGITAVSDAEGVWGVGEYVRAANFMHVTWSDGVTIEDSHVSNFRFGFQFFNSSNVNLTGTEITALQADAVRLVAVQDVLIQGNHFHDMLGSSHNYNHDDMIQIWGTNTTRNTERVIIDSNIFASGEGEGYQVIFGRNEDIRTNGFIYEGLEVTNNVIHGGTGHRINMSEATGMLVANNTVIYNADSINYNEAGDVVGASVGWINVPADSTVEYNIASQINNVSPDAPNFITSVQNHLSDQYIGDLYVNYLAHGSADLRDLQLDPDSPLNGQYGSSLLWATETADSLMAVAKVRAEKPNSPTMIFDASLSKGPDGYVDPDTSRAIWTFDDGTVKEGFKITHTFETYGKQGYRLEVVTLDGDASIDRTVRVENPWVVRAQVVEGGLDVLEGSLPVDSAAISDKGIRLDGGKSLSMWNDGLHQASAFNVSFDVEPLHVREGGTLFYVHEVFQMEVWSGGHATITLTTDAGRFTLPSSVALFDRSATDTADQRQHISLNYDNDRRVLELYKDGELLNSVEAYGSTPPQKYWGIVFGKNWGGSGSNFDGYLDRIEIKSDSLTSKEILEVSTREEMRAILDPEVSTPEPEAPVYAPEDAALRVRVVDGALDYTAGTTAINAAITDKGIRLDGNKVLSLWDDGLHQSSGFNVAFDVEPLRTAETGTLFYVHKVLQMQIWDGGSATITLNTDAGEFKLRSGVPLFDRTATDTADQRQHISLNYDAERGVFELYKDGTLLNAVEAHGSTPPQQFWGIDFGQTWGNAGSNFDGYIDRLEILETPLTAEAVALQYGDDTWGTPVEDTPRPAPEDTLPDPEDTLPVPEDTPPVPEDILPEPEVPVYVPEDAALRMRVVDGVLAFSHGTMTVAAENVTDKGIRLDGDNVMTLRDDALHQSSGFNVAFDVEPLRTAETGTLFYVHRVLQIQIWDGGSATITLNTDAGEFKLRSGVPLFDRTATDTADQRQHISLNYDAERGVFELYKDGTLLNAVEAHGSTPPQQFWGIDFGQTWGSEGSNFDGYIDRVEILEAPLTADAVALQYGDDAWGTPVADTPVDVAGPSLVQGTMLALDPEADMLSALVPEDMDMAAAFPETETDFQAGAGRDMIMWLNSTDLPEIAQNNDPVLDSGQGQFDVDIRANAAAQSGQVPQVQDRMGMQVEGDDLAFTLATSNGAAIELATTSDILTDISRHSDSIAYDSVEEVLRLSSEQESLSLSSRNHFEKDDAFQQSNQSKGEWSDLSMWGMNSQIDQRPDLSWDF